jgi:tRNA 2-thiouridine synthesizing protein E
LDREFVVTLILAIPIILVPGVLLWYLKRTSIGTGIRATSWRQAVREEGIRAAGTGQRLSKQPMSERYATRRRREEVGMQSKNTVPKAIEDSFKVDELLLTVVPTAVTPELDDYGYMRYPDLWTERIAEMLAQGLVPEGLTTEHWSVIYYLRHYYLEFGTPPPVKMLCKDTGLSLRQIYELFPGNCPRGWGAGLAKCACKIAGMPSLIYKLYP